MTHLQKLMVLITKRNLHKYIRLYKFRRNQVLGKKSVLYSITKRQKFVAIVVVLSLGFFLSEYQFGKSGILSAILLSLLTDTLLFWSLYEDMKGSVSIHIFILPFFYSLSFGLFYFLVPSRFLTRSIATGLYALGLYSLLLCQNIFTVSAIRTITLLSSARIVSAILTLLSFFFLTNIIFTLHVSLLLTSFLIFLFSFFLIFHVLWTYTLEKALYPAVIWSFGLSLCLLEISLILWFWPSIPTIVALFLTGIFYTLSGLSHAWIDRRLFRSVLWEYVWVSAIVFFILLSLTQWGS